MPYSHLNRMWDTGEVMRELPMPEALFGAPYLCMHRADLHSALASVVPAETIHLNKKLAGLDQKGAQVTMSFADGAKVTADAVIGADGVHSLVRDIVVGPDAPSIKAESPIGPTFPRRIIERAATSGRRARNGGASTATS